MSKVYDLDFKLQVVKMHDNQKEGYLTIAKRIGIHPSMVQRWVSKYHSLGIEGLMNRSTNTEYTEDFKNKVKEEIKRNVSVNSLVCKYNISPSTILRWRLECGMAEEKIINDEELKLLREKFKETKAHDYQDQYQ